jgi:hypothetical protein
VSSRCNELGEQSDNDEKREEHAAVAAPRKAAIASAHILKALYALYTGGSVDGARMSL